MFDGYAACGEEPCSHDQHEHRSGLHEQGDERHGDRDVVHRARRPTHVIARCSDCLLRLALFLSECLDDRYVGNVFHKAVLHTGGVLGHYLEAPRPSGGRRLLHEPHERQACQHAQSEPPVHCEHEDERGGGK